MPIKKENNDDNKVITNKIKFIDSCRFMQSTLSDLVDNLSEINNKMYGLDQNLNLLGLKIID